MITPRNPVASSPDDDPTGVRALLSALPEPDPMPAYLVERIGASLAAEQSQRATDSSAASVTPLTSRTRRRPGRLLFAIAGTAAAVAMIGVVGSNLLNTNQPTAGADSAAAAITSSREAEGAAPTSANDKATPGPAAGASDIQVRSSATRYTGATFATQAQALRPAAMSRAQSGDLYAAEVGPIGTPAGLEECLKAIGAGGAQIVRADLAFFDGQPAVIIVATTDGIRTAYAVDRTCSRANAALLHPATRLP